MEDASHVIFMFIYILTIATVTCLVSLASSWLHHSNSWSRQTYRYNVFSVTLRGGKAILGYRPDTGDQARTIWLDHNLTLGIKFTFSMSGCPMISSISVTRSRSLAHTSLMLTFLDMSECSALDNTGLTITLLHCPHLTHLYIRKCNNVSGKTIKSDNSAILSLTSQVSITIIPIFFWHNY